MTNLVLKYVINFTEQELLEIIKTLMIITVVMMPVIT